MKRKLLLAILTIISIGCFADSQPTDAERKANLFIYNGMLFSIQHFESIGSQNNTVEFCGWTTKTSVANELKDCCFKRRSLSISAQDGRNYYSRNSTGCCYI